MEVRTKQKGRKKKDGGKEGKMVLNPTNQNEKDNKKKANPSSKPNNPEKTNGAQVHANDTPMEGVINGSGKDQKQKSKKRKNDRGQKKKEENGQKEEKKEEKGEKKTETEAKARVKKRRKLSVGKEERGSKEDKASKTQDKTSKKDETSSVKKKDENKKKRERKKLKRRQRNKKLSSLVIPIHGGEKKEGIEEKNSMSDGANGENNNSVSSLVNEKLTQLQLSKVVSYLATYVKNKKQWKFAKSMQSLLERIVFDSDQLNEENFQYYLKYLEGGNGEFRKRTKEFAQKIVQEGEKTTDGAGSEIFKRAVAIMEVIA